MAREMVRFCWTTLIVWVLSHHYFRATIVEWEITTVITVKMLAFDVETLKVKNSFLFRSILWNLPSLTKMHITHS